MQVDHGQALEDRTPDERAVGDHHAEVGIEVEHLLDAVDDGQPQLLGRRLHRARRETRSPGPAWRRPA